MEIHYLSDFLEKAQCQFRIYDLGRKVKKISASDFKAVELNQRPYPFPLQQQACIAVVFWQPRAEQQHYIWFLKLPLDERGLLKAGPQTHFIQLVVEALGNELQSQPTEKQQERLANNPYTFKPAENKKAVFNAIINKELIRPASRYYEDCHAYLSGQLGWSNWQDLGLQGFADIAARLDADDNQQHIIGALPHLPAEVFCNLCEMLEHHALATPLVEALVAISQEKQAQGDDVCAILALRATASSPATGLRQDLIKQHLDTELALNPQWYVAVVARCWQDLTEPEILDRFCEAAAQLSEGQVFAQLFVDLVAQPDLRPLMLQKIRSPERSPAMAQAVSLLFS